LVHRDKKGFPVDLAQAQVDELKGKSCALMWHQWFISVGQLVLLAGLEGDGHVLVISCYELPPE